MDFSKWLARVDGDRGVLGILADEAGGPQWRIVRDGEGFAINAPSLDAAASPAEAKEEALRLVAEISSIARLGYQLRDPLEYGGVLNQLQDGRRSVFVEAEAVTCTARVYCAVAVMRPDGTVERPDPPSVQMANALSTDPRLAALANAYGQARQDWHGLYKMYERIEECVPGGLPTLMRAGWVTQKQFQNFDKSANDPAVSGDDARHAVSDGYPPAQPMTMDEGRVFIEGLLKRLIMDGIPKNYR